MNLKHEILSLPDSLNWNTQRDEAINRISEIISKYESNKEYQKVISKLSSLKTKIINNEKVDMKTTKKTWKKKYMK